MDLEELIEKRKRLGLINIPKVGSGGAKTNPEALEFILPQWGKTLSQQWDACNTQMYLLWFLRSLDRGNEADKLWDDYSRIEPIHKSGLSSDISSRFADYIRSVVPNPFQLGGHL